RAQEALGVLSQRSETIHPGAVLRCVTRRSSSWWSASTVPADGPNFTAPTIQSQQTVATMRSQRSNANDPVPMIRPVSPSDRSPVLPIKASSLCLASSRTAFSHRAKPAAVPDHLAAELPRRLDDVFQRRDHLIPMPGLEPA